MNLRLIHITAEGEGVPAVLDQLSALLGLDEQGDNAGDRQHQANGEHDRPHPKSPDRPALERREAVVPGVEGRVVHARSLQRLDVGSGGHVLDHAPTELADLPAFFDSLPDDQLDTGWVACIIECAVSEVGKVSVPALAAALNTVRSRYRAASIERSTPCRTSSPPPSSGPYPAPSPGSSSPQSPPSGGGSKTEQLIAAALERLPKESDECSVHEICPDALSRNLLGQFIRKGRDPRLEWIPGQGRTPARIRRVA